MLGPWCDSVINVTGLQIRLLHEISKIASFANHISLLNFPLGEHHTSQKSSQMATSEKEHKTAKRRVKNKGRSSIEKVESTAVPVDSKTTINAEIGDKADQSLSEYIGCIFSDTEFISIDSMFRNLVVRFGL